MEHRTTPRLREQSKRTRCCVVVVEPFKRCRLARSVAANQSRLVVRVCRWVGEGEKYVGPHGHDIRTRCPRADARHVWCCWSGLASRWNFVHDSTRRSAIWFVVRCGTNTGADNDCGALNSCQPGSGRLGLLRELRSSSCCGRSTDLRRSAWLPSGTRWRQRRRCV